MSSEVFIRRVKRIHLGNNKFLDERAIEMEWFGGDEEDEEPDDEMETLATVRFNVNSEEYAEMAKLGMVDSVPGGDDEDRSCRVAFRTDRDLLDEAEEQLREEWAAALEDSTDEPEIWNDLDYWEVLEIQ